MPNIEMRGFYGVTENSEEGLRGLLKSLEIFSGSIDDVTKKIQECLKDAPYAGDVVITSDLSISENLDEEPQPYLRLYGTSQAELDDLVKRIDPIGFDIEVMPIIRFVPRISQKPPLVPIKNPA